MTSPSSVAYLTASGRTPLSVRIDHTAALLLRTLQQNGVRVPQDVRVVGFDDAKFATLISPSLTTARQPCNQLAIAAFRAMLERQSEPTLPARHIMILPWFAIPAVEL